MQHTPVYKMERTLGKGAFAKVKLASDVNNNKKVAIKLIEKSLLTKKLRQMLNRELEIMKVVNHPNIARLEKVIDVDKYTIIVMEYCAKGELFDYVMKRKLLDEGEAKKIFHQIASAVQHCHSKNIIHRDLKLENILFDENMQVKIIDFGLSYLFTSSHILKTCCGSLPFSAPELHKGEPYEGPKVDIWAMGVILLAMLTGQMPFNGRTNEDLIKKIKKAKYSIPGLVSEECAHLLKRMLKVDPAKRIDINGIMDHPWLCEVASSKICKSSESGFSDEVNECRKTSNINSNLSLHKSEDRAVVNGSPHGSVDNIGNPLNADTVHSEPQCSIIETLPMQPPSLDVLSNDSGIISQISNSPVSTGPNSQEKVRPRRSGSLRRMSFRRCSVAFQNVFRRTSTKDSSRAF